MDMRTKHSLAGGVLNECRGYLFGVAALLIVLGHSQNFLSSIFPQKIIDLIGYGGIGVTMFAFLSAIGLWQSLEQNPSVKEFYFKRIKKVLIPYLIIAVPFYLVYGFWQSRSILDTITDISLIGYWLYGRGAWYIAWILPVYLVYPFYKKIALRPVVKTTIALLLIAAVEICCFVFNPSLLVRFQSVIGATIAFVIGDFVAPCVKGDKSKLLLYLVLLIIIAPLYILGILKNDVIYPWFFALCGIGLCGLFAIFYLFLHRRVADFLSTIGAASLESYLLNIYIISAARILLGDRINDTVGVITYLVIIAIGVGCSCVIGRRRIK